MRIKWILLIPILLLAVVSCKKESESPLEPEDVAKIEMVLVEGGTFTMGSPDGVGLDNEHPQHTVSLSSFYIGKYEVTRKLWWEVVQWKQDSAISPLPPPIPATSRHRSICLSKA